MKSIIALTLLASLSACNTFEGMGRDLAAGGEAIQGAAVEAQRPLPPQPIYRQPVQPVQPAPTYQTAPYEAIPQQAPNTQYVY